MKTRRLAPSTHRLMGDVKVYRTEPAGEAAFYRYPTGAVETNGNVPAAKGWYKRWLARKMTKDWQ